MCFSSILNFVLHFWVSVCSCSVLNEIGTKWQKYPTPPWASRAGLATLRFNDLIFVFGGQSGEGSEAKLFNDVWYSSDLQTWTSCPLSEPQWSQRVDFAYLVILIIVAQNLPIVVYKSCLLMDHTEQVHNNSIYVIAGYSFKSITEQDVWRSNAEVTAFSFVGSAPELKRRSATALSFAGSIFVFGGFCTYLSTYCINTDAAVLSSMDGMVWHKVKLNGYEWAGVSVGMFGGATAGGFMFLFDGGFTFKVTGNTFELNRVKLSPIDLPRSSSVFLPVYNTLWVITGQTSASQYPSDVYVSFDLGKSWDGTDQVRDNSGNLLTTFARSGSAGVLFGNQVCIMGGLFQGTATKDVFCSVPQIYPAPIFSIISSPRVIAGTPEIIHLWALLNVSALIIPGIPGVASITCTISISSTVLDAFNYTSPYNLSIGAFRDPIDEYTVQVIAVPNLDGAAMFVFSPQASISRVTYVLRNRLPSPTFDSAAGQVAKNTVKITCALGYVNILAPASASSKNVADANQLISVLIKLVGGSLITVTAECFLRDWPTSPQVSSQFFFYQLTQPAVLQQSTIMMQATSSSSRARSTSTSVTMPQTTRACSPPVVQTVQLSRCCPGLDCSCKAATTGGDSLILLIAGLTSGDYVQIEGNATPCPLTGVIVSTGASDRECKNLVCFKSSCSCQLPGGVGKENVFWTPVQTGGAWLSSWILIYSRPVLSQLVFDAGSTTLGGQITVYGKNFGGSLNGPMQCPCLYQNLGIMSQLVVGNTAALDILWTSDSAIIASVNPGVGSNLLVSLTLQGETAQDILTYSYQAPKITGLSTQLGPYEGGLELTVYGSSFGTQGSINSQVLVLDSLATLNYSKSLGQYYFSSQANRSCSAQLWISDSSMACTTPAGYGLKKKVGLVIAQQLAIYESGFNFVEWSPLVLIICNASAEFLRSPMHSESAQTESAQTVVFKFISWLRVILNLQMPDQIYFAGLIDSGTDSLTRKTMVYTVTTIQLRFLEVPDSNSPNVQQILSRLKNTATMGIFNMSIIPILGLQIGNTYIAVQNSVNVTPNLPTKDEAKNFTVLVISVVCCMVGLLMGAAVWRYGKCKRFSSTGRFTTSARVASSLVWFRGMHVNNDGNERDEELHPNDEIRNVAISGDLDDSDLCCICLDAKREAVIVHDDIGRSRHKALCIGCAYKIADSTATCPLCRLPILAVLHDPSSGV